MKVLLDDIEREIREALQQRVFDRSVQCVKLINVDIDGKASSPLVDAIFMITTAQTYHNEFRKIGAIQFKRHNDGITWDSKAMERDKR